MTKGMSRRGLLVGTSSVVSMNIGAGLWSRAHAETSTATSRPRTRAILLGTAGGPLPKASRYQTSQVVITTILTSSIAEMELAIAWCRPG
jgi:hypothetical protein